MVSDMTEICECFSSKLLVLSTFCYLLGSQNYTQMPKPENST